MYRKQKSKQIWLQNINKYGGIITKIKMSIYTNNKSKQNINLLLFLYFKWRSNET